MPPQVELQRLATPTPWDASIAQPPGYRKNAPVVSSRYKNVCLLRLRLHNQYLESCSLCRQPSEQAAMFTVLALAGLHICTDNMCSIVLQAKLGNSRVLWAGGWDSEQNFIRTSQARHLVCLIVDRDNMPSAADHARCPPCLPATTGVRHQQCMRWHDSSIATWCLEPCTTRGLICSHDTE
jgi:hypothetical protein